MADRNETWFSNKNGYHFVRWYNKNYPPSIYSSEKPVEVTDNQELEEKLKAANLKITALEIMLEKANKELAVDIVQKVWYQTANEMKKLYSTTGLEKICMLFGKTRQAFYDHSWRQTDNQLREYCVSMNYW